MPREEVDEELDKMMDEFQQLRSSENLLGQKAIEESLVSQGKFLKRQGEYQEQLEYREQVNKIAYERKYLERERLAAQG